MDPLNCSGLISTGCEACVEFVHPPNQPGGFPRELRAYSEVGNGPDFGAWALEFG